VCVSLFCLNCVSLVLVLLRLCCALVCVRVLCVVCVSSGGGGAARVNPLTRHASAARAHGTGGANRTTPTGHPLYEKAHTKPRAIFENSWVRPTHKTPDSASRRGTITTAGSPAPPGGAPSAITPAMDSITRVHDDLREATDLMRQNLGAVKKCPVQAKAAPTPRRGVLFRRLLGECGLRTSACPHS
jgi:hypothetical protein